MGKKSYFTLALLGAVLGMSALSSCKDNNDDLYEDLRLEQAKDYADLVNQLDNLEKKLLAIKGCDCTMPVIEIKDGYWYINGNNTGVKAAGLDGNTPVITIGDNGNWFVDGVDTGVKAKGEDAVAPVVTIGENGNWFVNGEDTGVKAKGEDAVAPVVTIGENGNWFVNGEDTGVKAKGEDAVAPVVTIGENGNWFVNGEDTGVKAKGEDAVAPVVTIGENGNWFINGEDTGVSATASNGKSAYQIWCDTYKPADNLSEYDLNEDGEITEEDFMLWLKGKDGDTIDHTKYDEAYSLLLNVVKYLDPTKDELDATTITSFIDQIKAALLDLSDLKADAQNRINSIVLNVTDNPVIGSLNTPFGLKSSALLAYFGETVNKVTFPGTGSTIGYINENEAITTDEAAIISATLKGDVFQKGSGVTMVSETQNNAGNVYVTINPSTVNFEGETLSLVNSRGEAPAVALSPLKKSNKAIEFGWTRAEGGAFYEAAASISANAIKNNEVYKFEFDVDQIKETATTFVDALRNRKMTEVAETVYSMVNNGLQSYALKASYQGINGTSNVYSDYNLAAAAVNAPSFGLIDQIPYVWTVPGYERAENLINRVAAKLNKIFDKLPNSVSIKNIEVPELESLDKLVIRLSTVMDPFSDMYYIAPVTDSNGNYVLDEDGNKTWRVYDATTNEGVNDIELNDTDAATLLACFEAGNYASAPEYVEAFIVFDFKEVFEDLFEEAKDVDEVKRVVNFANKLLKQLNSVQGTVNDLANSAINLLDRANGLVAGFINNLGYYVKPALLSSTSEGVKMLSTYKAYPTPLAESELDFIATSMSAELIVPFVKKHLAVVNVYDAAGEAVDNAQELANAVNESGRMNEVIDGVGAGTLSEAKPAGYVPAAGFQAGYVYEIAYSVVDYAGYVSTRRYYVTVK